MTNTNQQEELYSRQDLINAWNSAYGGDSYLSGEDYVDNLLPSPPVEDGKLGGEVEELMLSIVKKIAESSIISRLAKKTVIEIITDAFKSQPSTPVQDGWVRVEDVIYAIRESFVGADKVYTQGSCYQFYKILKSIFPQAIDYYDMNHVVTEIDGVCYDINGVVDKGICLLMSEHYPDAGVKNYRYNIYDNAIEQWKLQP